MFLLLPVFIANEIDIALISYFNRVARTNTDACYTFMRPLPVIEGFPPRALSHSLPYTINEMFKHVGSFPLVFQELGETASIKNCHYRFVPDLFGIEMSFILLLIKQSRFNGIYSYLNNDILTFMMLSNTHTHLVEMLICLDVLFGLFPMKKITFTIIGQMEMTRR